MNKCRRAEASARCRLPLPARVARAPSRNESSPIQASRQVSAQLRGLAVSLVPKRVYLERFTAGDAVTSLQPGDDPHIASAVPRCDRDLAMLEHAGAHFDERVVIVDVKNERVLRYHQRF